MLTKNQKAYLAQLAQRAFNLECAKARGRGEAVDSSTKAFEAWRHKEVGKACGKLGLRCCDQRDYKAVEAHFLNLVGETGKAMNALMRSQTEDLRQWQHKVIGMCRALDKPLSFANGICRRMFRGLPLDDATPEQLKKVFFALKYQLQRETKQQNDFQEV